MTRNQIRKNICEVYFHGFYFHIQKSVNVDPANVGIVREVNGR